MYMWCSDKGLMGWRVKGGVSKLSAALGKLPLREVMSSVLPSWPVNQEVTIYRCLLMTSSP